jgi:acetyl-CoA carboxylase biotin carboxyl carrier protein
MSTNDQNQGHGGGGQGQAAAPAPQADSGAERGQRHGRGRHRGRQPSRPQPPQGQPRRGESALNMDELRELTELFSAHSLTEFEFENADIRIRLSRNPAPGLTAAPPAAAPPAPPLAAMREAAPAAQGPAEAPAAAPEAPPAEDLHIITSPIVGTFYRSPSPDAEPFVKAGSRVDPDTVVCIIEAMKLMNEIPAETSGTVEKIYVENGQPVEYGQPLFGIKR